MELTCQERNVQSDGASVMYRACTFGMIGDPLMRQHTNLTGDMYVGILSVHVPPFTPIGHSDGFGQFHTVQKDTPHVESCYPVAPGLVA